MRHVALKKKQKSFIDLKHIGHRGLLLCLVLLPFIFCKSSNCQLAYDFIQKWNALVPTCMPTLYETFS